MASQWWLIFISGFIFIGLGLWIVLSPLQSYFTISMFLAATVCIAGLMEVMFSLINHKNLHGWGWYLAGGIIDIVVGGYLLAYPLLTMVLLPVLLGAWMLYRGIVTFSHSFSLRSLGLKGWRWLLLAGIIIILLGALILVNPVLGVFNFVVWTGFAFIMSGVFRIALAIKLKAGLP